MKYENYIKLDYQPSDKDLIALYRVEPSYGYTILDCASRIASESSTGTWAEINVSKIVDTISAKVFRVDNKWVYIAYPTDLFEKGNLVQIMSSIAGNIFGMKAVKNIRLEDVSWPIKVKRWFKGPNHGIDGVRNILHIYKRPITATVPKPKVGLTTDEFVENAEKIWEGGIDLVKDDENLTSLSFNKFRDRLRKMFRARERIENITGDRKGYLINISAPYREMIRRAREVADWGGEFVMIDVLTVGFSGVQSFIEEMIDYKFAIHAHRAFHAAFTRNPRHGMSMKVIVEIFRMLGVDHIHVGTVVGKLHGTLKEVMGLAKICRSNRVNKSRRYLLLDNDWTGIKPIFPVSSGGLHPGLLPYVFKLFGKDVIIQVGGGVIAHPDGILMGAKAVRKVVDGLIAGLSIEEIAKEEREVARALDKWGKETPI